MRQLFTNDLQRFNSHYIWLLTIVGLAIRVTAVFMFNDYRDPLTAEYGIVARNLVEGKGFVGGGWFGPEMPTALNTPIYPLFLAAWLWLGGSLPFLWVEICQALLSALVIYLISKIASQFFDPAVSLLSCLFITFYPPLIYFCKQISPAIFTTFSAAVSLYTLLFFFKKPSWSRAITLGLIGGISLLTEPVLLLALPGVTLVVWRWWYKGNMRRILQMLAFSGMVCMLVLLPWTTRNYIVFRRIVPLKTSFGLNLWLGNNPNATGLLYTYSGEPMQETLSASMLEYLGSLNEAERYAVLQREALKWIKSHPIQFMRLTLRRIYYFWVISPTYLITKQNIIEPNYFYLLRQVIQIVLLILASAGSILAYRQSRLFFVISVWWLVAFTIPYAVSVAGNTRYRLPAEPILIILSAVFCHEIIKRVRKMESKITPDQPAL